MANHDILRRRLNEFFTKKHGTSGAKLRRLQLSTKRCIRKAILEASKSCELHGYFLTIVWESSSRISAKLFQFTDRDGQLQPASALTQQNGYSITFQIFVADSEVVVNAYRPTPTKMEGKKLVSSDDLKTLQDAVYIEVENFIVNGAKFLPPAQ